LANSDFGLRLGIDGERDFKKALADINQSFKVLGSEMALVTSQFDKNDSSVKALTSRNEVLNREIETQKDKISTLRSALENAATSFGENDKRTQNWQIQLNKAQAELNGMERELSDNNKALNAESKALDETGKGMNEMGKETKNLGGEMEETGKKTSVFGDVLKASLAADAIKAGLSALVDMVKAVGTAVKDYVSEGSQMAADAAENHMKLTTVMRNMMDATDDEIQSIVELTKAQEQLGVISSAVQVAGAQELGTYLEKKSSLEAIIPVMNDMIAQQYGVNASQENAVGIAMMLGKVMNGQVGALSRYGYTFDEAQAQILKFGTESERAAVLADVVRESVGGMNEALAQTDAGKMTSLNNVLDNTKISVGAMANEFKAQVMGQMLPSISSLADAFLGVMRGEDSVEGMAAAFSGVFSEIVNIIDEQLPQLLELGSQLLTAVVTGLTDNIDVIITGALSIMDALIAAIIDLLPLILEAGGKLLLGFLEGIMAALPSLAEAAVQMIAMMATGLTEALPTLIPTIVRVMEQIVTVLIQNLPLLLDAALQLIVGLAEGFLDAIPELVKALPAIIQAIVEFVLGAIPQIIEAGIQLLVSLVAALPDIIMAVVEAIPQIIEGLVTAIIGSIPILIDAGIKLLVALIQNLPLIITTIVKAIPEIIKGLVSALSNSIPQLVQAGVKLFISLIENLPMIIWEIIKAVPQIITGIVGAFRDLAWQIVQIGGDLIKGIWQGISDAGAWLRDKISGFFSGVVDSIKNFFGIGSPSRLFAELGGFMAEGLGVGFGEEMNKVGRDMQNAIPRDFDIGADIHGAYATSGVGVGFEPSSGIVNNFNISELIVREEADIHKIAGQLFRLQQQNQRGRGVAFA